MKLLRHSKILEIIQTKKIMTQEELAEALRDEGFDVTQATVSRDIKELKLIKIQDADGGYRYSSGLQSTNADVTPKYRNILFEAVTKADFAGNIAVVKCHSGMGMAAATAIDAVNAGEIVGSIAGDDTIIVVLRNESGATQFVRELNKMLKR